MSDFYDDERAQRKEKNRWRQFIEDGVKRDPVLDLLKADLQKLQGEVQRYASGTVNLKRDLLVERIEQQKAQAMQTYLENRREAAEHYRGKVKEAIDKRLATTTDTKRLADVQEARLRYEAMSDDALARHAMRPAGLPRDKDDAVLTLFRNHADYAACRAELRRRGEGDLASQLEERCSELPKDGFGDVEIANNLRVQRFYELKPERDAILVADMNDAIIGVPFDELVDTSGLEVIPN